jgi:hypothetical protein
MGQSTNGILAYGYDLGGGDEWKVQEAGEYGGLPQLNWYNPDDEDSDGFPELAERRLLAEITGFTETWSSGNEGYFDREKAVKGRLGIQLGMYCSHEYPEYLLATEVITVYRGDIKGIDMADLAGAPAREGWDDKLRAALTVLGLTPKQDRAKWLLCSYWG